MNDISKVIEELRAARVASYGLPHTTVEYKRYDQLAAKHMPTILDAYKAAVADGAALREMVEEYGCLLAGFDHGSVSETQQHISKLLAYPSPGQQLLEELKQARYNALNELNAKEQVMAERDRMREQLEAAVTMLIRVAKEIKLGELRSKTDDDWNEFKRDHPELFQNGGGE